MPNTHEKKRSKTCCRYEIVLKQLLYNYFQGPLLFVQLDWQLQNILFPQSLNQFLNWIMDIKIYQMKKKTQIASHFYLNVFLSACSLLFLVKLYALRSSLFLLEMQNDDKLINLLAPTKLNSETTPTRPTRRIVFYVLHFFSF